MKSPDRGDTEYAALREYLCLTGSATRGLAGSLSVALQSELTPRQRQMVVMFYMEEKNMTEIARVLGVNVSTVSRTISRGKLRLRRCLKYGGKALLDAISCD